MKNLSDDMRERAARFLKAAANIVMRSYGQYLKASEDPTTDKIKKAAEFKAFHDAGKSAPSHLEVIMKLSKGIESTNENSQNDDEELGKKIIAANLEISQSKDVLT